MRLHALLFTICILLFSSCGDKSGTTDETGNEANEHVVALHNEVMAYHDEVMPHIGELVLMQNELLAATDTLEEDLALHSSEVAMQLESAEEAMMVWMRQFSSQLTNKDTIAAISYYEDQLIKVKEMRDEVTNALDSGRNQTQALKNNQ